MDTPHDVQELMEILRQLDVFPGLVAKAEEILSAKASDIGEWIELAAHSGLKIRQNSRFGNRMTEWTIIETVH